jgi:hypothetical protein
MNRLSPETERLVALARHQDDPDGEACRRVERRLAARIAAGAGVAGASASASAAGGGAATAMTIKVVLLAGAVVTGAAGGFWALRPAHAPGARAQAPAAARASGERGPQERAAAPPADAPAAIETRAIAGTPAPSAAAIAAGPASPRVRVTPRAPIARVTAPRTPEPAAPAPVTVVPAPPAPTASLAASRPAPARFAPETTGETRTAPAAGTEPLRLETAALRAAQRALRDGDGPRALGLLDQQDAQFAGGVLQEERAAARVLALCASRREGEARAAARAFGQRWPGSALLARVRSSCRER